MSDRLQGKAALITGAARGQGRSHALRLAAEGASIVGLDLCEQIPSVGYEMSTRDDLDETVNLVEQQGGKMLARIGDVRDIESVRAAYDAGVDRFDAIDYVVCNAGIMPVWGPGSDTPAAWQDSLDVMLTGVLNTIEVAWPRMVERGTGGSIVITGSMAAVRPMMRTLGGRTLGLLGYSAAKTALVSLAENYASILAYHQIRVNVLEPTGVTTPMIDNDMVRERFANVDPEDHKALVNAIPVDAIEPRDVSDAVAWLCSEESRFVTGSAIRIDAGAALR
ncbi:mycofactocin-coupled SDR family oxidoreductase [Streptomyces sp. NPDC001984]